jgi:sulfoxide reductase heme-binding subunit YedZ
MTRTQVVKWVVKPMIWAVGLGIPARLAWGAFHDALGADPVETIQRWTGRGALVGLFLCLAMTPLRRATGWNEAIRLRRLLGVFAFLYASLHVVTYVVFDQSLSLEMIRKDVMEHTWVTAGFVTWLLLVPLAVTSTAGMVRRLGGVRWRRLHQLVYLAAAGGVLHFLWLVKEDVATPARFGAVLVVLLATRLPLWSRNRPPAGAPAGDRARPPARRRPPPEALDSTRSPR